MKQKHLNSIPTNAELLSVVNGTDVLSVVVRGHQFVEAAVNAMISEALPAPHEVEIGRLTFALKVDLAISLRLLRPDSRPLFMAITKVRNRFAHDPGAVFDSKESNDLCNTFSAFQRRLIGQRPNQLSAPEDVLSRAIAVAFIEAKRSRARLYNGKLYDEALHEMVEGTLRHRDGMPPDEHSRKVEEELQLRFEKKKASRAELVT